MPQFDRHQPSSYRDGDTVCGRLPSGLGEREPRAAGARVDPQFDPEDLGVGAPAVLEPDGEGRVTCHGGPPPGQQGTGACRMARHEGQSVLGEDEHARATASGPCLWGVTAPVLCLFGVTPTRWGARPVGLPSPMSPAGASRLREVSARRFVPAPRGVCTRGFQSRLLRKHSLVGLPACRERSHRRQPASDPTIMMTGAGHSDSAWESGMRRGASDLTSPCKKRRERGMVDCSPQRCM